MSSNIQQIYIANPAASFQNSDLMYLGRSPYAPGNDMAFTYETLFNSLSDNFVWNNASMDATMSANNGYYTTSGSTLNLTLPATCAAGKTIRIAGASNGGWTIVQGSGQSIKFGNVSTTIGAGGSLSSTEGYDSIELLCTVANSTFILPSGPQGNPSWV